jgi:flagellar biosynthetic protein FlhB
MSGDTTQDKTESASPKRRREARKRGEVPRSRELTTALVMMTAAGTLIGSGGNIANGARQIMSKALSFDAVVLNDPSQMPALLGHTLFDSLSLFTPVILGLVVIALVAPMLLGGWNFSAQAALPTFSRINPLSGLARLFSTHSLMELLKNVLKFALLATVAGTAWWASRGELIGLGNEPGSNGVIHAGHMVLHAFAFMCGALLFIAALDVPYQLWSYEKKLRMTKQELREEYKESEGRPEVKQRIRRMQQQLSKRRMMEKVPTADVIVTNPTHYAVALKYKQGEMRAPVVVAKGVDQIALMIRELGTKNRIPILEAPPLARSLYRNTELDAEIPVNLYAAVAQVLTYVYQLKMYRSGQPPARPDIGDVPGGEVEPKN